MDGGYAFFIFQTLKSGGMKMGFPSPADLGQRREFDRRFTPEKKGMKSRGLNLMKIISLMNRD
jgi:hypothetical protein